MDDLATRFASGFQQLQARYPKTVVEVRQLGLTIDLVLPDQECGPLLARLLQDEGVLASHAREDARVLEFRPLPAMNEIEAEQALGALDRALRGLSQMRGWAICH